MQHGTTSRNFPQFLTIVALELRLDVQKSGLHLSISVNRYFTAFFNFIAKIFTFRLVALVVFSDTIKSALLTFSLALLAFLETPRVSQCKFAHFRLFTRLAASFHSTLTSFYNKALTWAASVVASAAISLILLVKFLFRFLSVSALARPFFGIQSQVTHILRYHHNFLFNSTKRLDGTSKAINFCMECCIFGGKAR